MEIKLHRVDIWNRATIADGKKLQATTIRPLSANDVILAEEVVKYINSGAEFSATEWALMRDSLKPSADNYETYYDYLERNEDLWSSTYETVKTHSGTKTEPCWELTYDIVNEHKDEWNGIAQSAISGYAASAWLTNNKLGYEFNQDTEIINYAPDKRWNNASNNSLGWHCGSPYSANQYDVSHTTVVIPNCSFVVKGRGGCSTNSDTKLSNVVKNKQSMTKQFDSSIVRSVHTYSHGAKNSIDFHTNRGSDGDDYDADNSVLLNLTHSNGIKNTMSVGFNQHHITNSLSTFLGSEIRKADNSIISFKGAGPKNAIAFKGACCQNEYLSFLHFNYEEDHSFNFNTSSPYSNDVLKYENCYFRNIKGLTNFSDIGSNPYYNFTTVNNGLALTKNGNVKKSFQYKLEGDDTIYTMTYAQFGNPLNSAINSIVTVNDFGLQYTTDTSRKYMDPDGKTEHYTNIGTPISIENSIYSIHDASIDSSKNNIVLGRNLFINSGNVDSILLLGNELNPTYTNYGAYLFNNKTCIINGDYIYDKNNKTSLILGDNHNIDSIENVCVLSKNHHTYTNDSKNKTHKNALIMGEEFQVYTNAVRNNLLMPHYANFNNAKDPIYGNFYGYNNLAIFAGQMAESTNNLIIDAYKNNGAKHDAMVDCITLSNTSNVCTNQSRASIIFNGYYPTYESSKNSSIIKQAGMVAQSMGMGETKYIFASLVNGGVNDTKSFVHQSADIMDSLINLKKNDDFRFQRYDYQTDGTNEVLNSLLNIDNTDNPIISCSANITESIINGPLPLIGPEYARSIYGASTDEVDNYEKIFTYIKKDTHGSPNWMNEGRLLYSIINNNDNVVDSNTRMIVYDSVSTTGVSRAIINGRHNDLAGHGKKIILGNNNKSLNLIPGYTFDYGIIIGYGNTVIDAAGSSDINGKQSLIIGNGFQYTVPGNPVNYYKAPGLFIGGSNSNLDDDPNMKKLIELTNASVTTDGNSNYAVKPLILSKDDGVYFVCFKGMARKLDSSKQKTYMFFRREDTGHWYDVIAEKDLEAS